MKLKPGTRFSLDVEQDARGYILAPRLYVGDKRVKSLGKPARCKTDEELYVEIETFAQRRLAQIGREKVKP